MPLLPPCELKERLSVVVKRCQESLLLSYSGSGILALEGEFRLKIPYVTPSYTAIVYRFWHGTTDPEL